MPEVANLHIGKDHNFTPDGAVPAETWRDCLVLAAGAAKTATVPPGANRVDVWATADVFVAYDAPAIIPGEDILDGSASDPNPGIRRIEAVAEISVVSPSDCMVFLTYWSAK